jgi:GNAT superfamily N-acetyltransferase
VAAAIVRALPEQAPVLAALGARTFRDTYTGAIPDAVLAPYLAAAFALEKQAAELADPRNAFWLALEGAQPVGYAKLTRSATPACVPGPAPCELQRFYIDRPWWGSGVAGQLMELVVDAARRLEAQTLWLGVWENNPRAIAFYGRSGFLDVGTLPFTLSGEVFTDRVLVRSLGS